MLEYRSFQVTLISASNLPDVRTFGETKVYAKISISRNSSGSVWYTPVDEDGGTNPYWNCWVRCLIPEDVVQEEDQSEKLVIKLYCKRSLLEDKYVGEVNIFLKRLFDSGLAGQNVEYNVYRNDDDGTFGTLKLSYSFGASTQKIDVQGESSSTAGRRHKITSQEIVEAVTAMADIMDAVSKVTQSFQG